MRDDRPDRGEPAPDSAGASETAVRAALAAACPGHEPVAVEPFGRGNRKRTVLVRFADREPVVVQTSGRAGALRAEASVLRALTDRTDVPVPAVVGAGTADGTGYLVTEHVAGEDLHARFTALDADTQRGLARTFGRHLGAVHEGFAFERYGPLAAAGSLRAEEGDWRAWLRSYGLGALERLPAAFDGLRERARELLAEPAVEPEPPATLFPWDFRPGNALVADGELVAVLDWEAPLAAAPALSVAKAEYLVADWYVDDPDPLRTAFRAGYQEVRPYPEVSPVHRVAAVADSAVDTAGSVTRPGFPERDRAGAVAFHRRALERALDG